MQTNKRKLFVYGLERRCRMGDFLREFERFGRVVKCEFPVPRDRTQTLLYAFVEFDDQMDAYEALKRLDGKVLFRERLRIEFAKGTSDQKPYERSGTFPSKRARNDDGSVASDSSMPNVELKESFKSIQPDENTAFNSSKDDSAAAMFRSAPEEEMEPTEY